MTATDTVAIFLSAIRTAGLQPPENIEPGVVCRFPGAGKSKTNRAGWCKMFSDGIGGVFGDFSTGLYETWQSDRPQTSQERAEFRRQVEQAKQQAEVERKQRQADAARTARDVWVKATPALSHSYLDRKSIKAHGVRVHDGRLVVPLRTGGKLVSLQFIAADGSKRFLSGGQVTGCYYPIGKITDAVCVCEGFATGASIHEATRYAVAVAFNAGNLRQVAQSLRDKYPDARLIVCADDDIATTGNPGITKATEAASAVGGTVAFPIFGDTRPPGATDFNDLAAYVGPSAVKLCIDNPGLSEDTLIGELRYIDHSTVIHTRGRHGRSPWRGSVALHFEHRATGTVVTRWYNADLGKYPPGEHGQFKALPPGSELRKFVTKTIGAPAKWCKCHERLHRLKQLKFTGAAECRKGDWVLAKNPVEIAPDSHRNRTTCSGGKSTGGKLAGGKLAGGKSTGGKLAGTKNTRKMLSGIEKQGTAGAIEKCDKKVRRKSAEERCDETVRHLPPKHQDTKENSSISNNSITTHSSPDPFCEYCNGSGCIHCFKTTLQQPDPDSVEPDSWTIEI